MSYRVGVIGCGRMAGTIDDEIDYPHPDFILPYGHAPGYAAVPETEIVAAADIDQTRLDTWCDRFGVTARYTDYRDMLASEDLDLVSTTTHAVARAPAVIAAAEAGVRGIYAEKALCASVAELDDILATCQRRNTQLVYGAMRRYWAGFETARKFLDSGALGSPLSVLIGCAGTPAFHGGSHFIDAALYLLGDPVPVSVRAELRGRDGGALPLREEAEGLVLDEDPGIAFASVEFDNGLRLTCGDLPYTEIEVVCEEGTLRSWGDSSGYAARRKTDRYTWEDVPFPDWESRSGTIAIIGDLIRSIESGEPGRSNLEVTRRGMEILFGMVASHAGGGVKVDLPLQDRQVRVGSR